MSAFEWGRMDRTTEGRMGREQLRRRGEEQTLEELAGNYNDIAAEALEGEAGFKVRDEVSRFAKKISFSEGPEQYEYLGVLAASLSRRSNSIFDKVPDDEHERAAFALALVKQYEKSIH